MIRKVRVVGAFWWNEASFALMYPFSGTLDLDPDTGEFTGHLADHYGHSFVRGKVDGVSLEFAKVYDFGSCGARGTIDYLLQAVAQTFTPGNGAWLGIYRIPPGPLDQDPPYDELTGRAYLLFLPEEVAK